MAKKKLDRFRRATFGQVLTIGLWMIEHGTFHIGEGIRYHNRGLTPKEIVYVQERLDKIQEARRDLRELYTKRFHMSKA